MFTAIGWGVIAAKTMVVAHFGQGAFVAVGETVAATAVWIMGLPGD
jgi:hypothetical protein